ncbi:glycosyltransferase family A protein [Pedobacter sp. L105]|uniref:glycosyltransferase family A protein n=1 Tax=Pedobacter sp. L105 TaxID=1641871 RepID=UPI00131D3F84|nr:glycosyltransferase family A protein [Pedobacter sp. L105]
MGLINDYYSYYNVILWKKNGVIRHYAMYFLSFEFFEEDFDYILFLKFDFPDAFVNLNIKEITIALESIYALNEHTFVVLTTRKDPPLFSESADEFIHSFSSSFIHFKNIADKYGRDKFLQNDLLFELLNQIFKGNSDFKNILVKQIPIQSSHALTMNNCDVIIPHRGKDAFLKNTLFFLNQLKHIHVYVGIDQPLSQEIVKLKDEYSGFSFYKFNPDPVGPYIIRNNLIDRSSNHLIFYQDSDDVPCADRFERIAAYMDSTGCQLCGSHELRLDYLERTVRAHRFPTNVISALQKVGGHPLFHPTSAITREAFYLCGKLSEERTFGNDTKFLLHSFFVLDNIRNIDDFLYIRRRHAESLTTFPDTMIGSPAREQLLYDWIGDFELVKSGLLELENSSLNYHAPLFKFKSEKI